MLEETRTVVFYESPYRLIKLLNELKEYFGEERKVSISRELTKKFEENFHGNVADAMLHFTQKEIKGEIVLVMEGKTIDETITKTNKEKYGK